MGGLFHTRLEVIGTKLHSFGPMGLEDLTTTKFIVYGDGQVRE